MMQVIRKNNLMVSKQQYDVFFIQQEAVHEDNKGVVSLLLETGLVMFPIKIRS